MTGGRLRKLKKYFKKDESFMLTYGDGMANVNLKKLQSFHLKKKLERLQLLDLIQSMVFWIFLKT